MGIRELRLDPALPLRRLLGAQFADEEPRLADIAKQAVVRFFAPGQREDALAWLRSR